MKEITPEEQERYAKIERYIRLAGPLWDLKPGDIVTQSHVDTIVELLGKKPKEESLIEVRFTKTGVPLVTKGCELIKEIKVYDETPEGIDP